jgi:cytochrome c556
MPGFVSVRPVILAALIALAASDRALAQTALTRQVMRDKLGRAEALLAALVTSNWAALERNSRELEALTTKPGWDVLRSPEYVKQTRAFYLTTEALTDAAVRHDDQAVLGAYNGLVASCVGCHRFVARARVARTAGRSEVPRLDRR